MLREIKSHTPHLAKVREHLRRFGTNYHYWHNSVTLCGACAISAYVTFLYFRKKGFSPKIVATDKHCWIEIDRYIIDLTATQFGVDEEVLILPKHKLCVLVEHRDDALRAYYEKKSIHTDMRSFRSQMNEWQEEQNPFYLKKTSKIMQQIMTECV